MITDEMLVAYKDRINDIVERADNTGDAAPTLGTVALLSLTDEQFAAITVDDVDEDVLLNTLESTFRRLAAAGINDPTGSLDEEGNAF